MAVFVNWDVLSKGSRAPLKGWLGFPGERECFGGQRRVLFWVT